MQGITTTLNELVRARPPRGLTGFAPSGRVSTHQWGANRSIFRGRGMEFAESRAYQPGDDVKSIDWRVTARTGLPHTKLFQEERERPVHILLDLRSMMQFGTRVRFKSHLAAEVAAMLSWVGHDGGDRVGGLILTRQGVLDFRAARTRKAVLRFLESVAEQTATDLEAGDEVSLANGLRRLRKSCRPGTLAFVISDFNDLDDNAAKELRRLSGTAHVTNIQISDPLDAALPSQAGRISDGDLALSLGSVTKAELQNYAAQFVARRSRLDRISRQNAMAIHHLQTSDDPATILHPKERKRSAA
ncbi:DUF58 domain-containing protein [Aliiroseovarius sp. 2305UL8-7]|uniref:DUF58 domain-containing protein n=1 Tax=Aliiroseovarius conchicola TaxID=3121637 RepID=UPI003529D40B